MERIAASIEPGAQIAAAIGGTAVMGASVSAAVAMPYQGAYSVTPSSEAQTLPVAGTTPLQDITVNPIPSNYGLITYNGSVITVS